MTWLGMDADAVEQAAREVERACERMEHLCTDIDRMLSHTEATWTGPDSDRYREQWHQSRGGGVRSALAALRSLVSTLRDNARRQREASANLGVGSATFPLSGVPAYAPFDPMTVDSTPTAVDLAGWQRLESRLSADWGTAAPGAGLWPEAGPYAVAEPAWPVMTHAVVPAWESLQ